MRVTQSLILTLQIHSEQVEKYFNNLKTIAKFDAKGPKIKQETACFA